MTIKEVAEAANVSTATVSRVLNHKGNVSDEVKEKVYAIIKQMNYHPNRIGQALRNTSTNTIILLANTISKPFFIEFFSAIQKAAYNHNYKILVGQYTGDEKILMNYVDMVLSHMADGMILVNHNTYIPYIESISRNFPIVQLCERTPESEIPYVSEDWYACTYKAIDYLLSTGRRKIAFINYAHTALFARKYFEGYQDAMKKYGLDISSAWTVQIPNMDFDPAYDEIKRILSMPNRPDALFVACDLYVTAALRAASELGLRVPDDISLICGDNSFIANVLTPSITTVDHQRDVMAESAINLLLERINNSSVSRSSITVTPNLIVRESTPVVSH